MSWKNGLMASAIFAFALGSLNAGETYKVDPEKSKVEFVGTKTDGKHEGGFKEVSGQATVDIDAPEESKLTMVIKTASIWSDDNRLTDHLKNADFFDVRKYPEITFESTKVEMTGEDEAILIGKLTMLGKTVETKIPVKSELGSDTLTIKSDFKIDRTKWGMDYGKGRVDDLVQLKVSLVLVR